MEEKICHMCHSNKERSSDERDALIKRLHRIEGQIRGISGMIERDAYCVDILTQVSAVSSAIDAFKVALLDNHVKTCVKNDVLAGNDEVLDELVTVISRMIR